MPVVCPHCSREFPGDRVNARHLAVCNPTSSPKVPPCLCGHESTSLTQMKRHRKDCPVWQSRDAGLVAETRRRETSVERYGVEDARRSPEANASREATNLERYGAANPFSREASTFEAVQSALEGKRPVLRGEDNPFARPEVQEKIRGHWQQEHGVDNPQQVGEIRARTRATHQERHGGELLASPSIRAKAEATNQAKYGAAFVGGTPEVQAKVVATNLERYGVPHTCMDPEVRAKQMVVMLEHYGSHFFASKVGRRTVRASMLERYGVEFPGAMEGHWERALETFHANYPEMAWPGMLAQRPGGPNKLEQKVWEMVPQLRYTGNGTFWKHLPKLKAYKNPDFVLPGPDPEHPFRGATKVVEVFGDYWHSRMKTGKVEFEHEQELIEAFRDIGLDCLIIWESEVKADPVKVQERLVGFLQGYSFP